MWAVDSRITDTLWKEIRMKRLVALASVSVMLLTACVWTSGCLGACRRWEIGGQSRVTEFIGAGPA